MGVGEPPEPSDASSFVVYTRSTKKMCSVSVS